MHFSLLGIAWIIQFIGHCMDNSTIIIKTKFKTNCSEMDVACKIYVYFELSLKYLSVMY